MKKEISIILCLTLILVAAGSFGFQTFASITPQVTVASYAGGVPGDIKVIPNMSASTYRFSDYACNFSTDFPAVLANATYIQTKYSDGEAGSAFKGSTSDPWITLTFNNSATLYYLTTSNYVGGSWQTYISTWNAQGGGWIKADGTLTTATADAKAWIVNTETNWVRSRVFLYQLDIDVPVGSTYTFVLPKMGTDASQSVYSLAVQWKAPSSKIYVPVNNPGFESGEMGNSLTSSFGIPGWTPFHTTSWDENLYYALGETLINPHAAAGTKPPKGSGKALSILDKTDAGNVFLKSDPFSLPAGAACKLSTYLWSDYRYGLSLLFFNENGEVYLNGGFVAATDVNLFTALRPSQIATMGKVWVPASIQETAPLGTVSGRIVLYGSNSIGNQASIGFDDVSLVYEVTPVQVTVAGDGNGVVTNEGVNSLSFGESLEITATPSPGKMINEIRFNGNVVLSHYYGSFTYTTPAITGERTVLVTFKEVPTTLPSELSVPSQAYTPEVPEAFLDKNNNSVIAPHGIAFAKAYTTFGKYTRKEYGMLLSSTAVELGNFNKENPALIVAKGLKSPNSQGAYGILFYGSGIIVGETYYVRAYAVYEDETGTEYTVYGEEIHFFTPKV